MGKLTKAELQRENGALREALIWASGSPDFGPGGQARKGWLKVAAPLIKGHFGDEEGID